MSHVSNEPALKYIAVSEVSYRLADSRTTDTDFKAKSGRVSHSYIAQKGFTFIELMVAVALIGVLLGIGVPSFQSMMQSSRIIGDYNSLVGSLNFGRSEAIKRASSVSVCARETDTSCGNDWSNGWLVFDDAGDTRGFIDTDEFVLKSVSLDSGAATLVNSARLNNGAAEPVARPFIQFQPRGTANWRGAGYFIFCDERGTQSARVANISLAGSVRRGRKDADGNLLNVFNEAATCP